MEHKPRKRLGQHFLHDANSIRRIVAAIAPRPGDTMVEIGPGLGAITRPLLEALGQLTVVEFDRDVIPLLQAACAGLGDLRVHQQDALRFDFSSLARPDVLQPTLRVVGNLPYNISTPLLFHLLDSHQHIKDMHFLLQKEVVDRLSAAPGSEHYGRLSVMVQYRCQVEALFGVGPGAFRPPPRVDSAVVRLLPYARLPCVAEDERQFAQLVQQAFAQRRKTLHNALKRIPNATPAMQAIGLDPGLRAERLGVADFVRLSNQVLHLHG